MTRFLPLERLNEITFIAAQVTVLYAVIPCWRKHRLRFALLLAWASSLSLLVYVSILANRQSDIVPWIADFVMATGLRFEVIATVVWFAWMILSIVSILLYGAAIVLMGRHFSRAPARRAEGQEPLPQRPEEPKA